MQALTEELLAFHIHQHLDIFINRHSVKLSGGIGIHDNRVITQLHTHDDSGVIHIESGERRPYSLGQLFGEWGVKLDSHCIGHYCGQTQLWVDGKSAPLGSDPAAHLLKNHETLVLAVGGTPEHIASSYSFGK